MTAAPGAPLTRIDHAVLRTTRRLLGNTPAVPVAQALSQVGEHALGWIALSSLGWAVSPGRRGAWTDALVGTVAAHASAVLVKRVVRRPRPTLLDLPPLVGTPSRLSFPSAHACSTTAAAVGLAPMLGLVPVASVTGAMLVSRVLLGVHYPTDVLAGAVLGGGVAATVARAGRRCREDHR